MYNPKDVLTEAGYEDYKAHLRNIENGLFYIQNHADDLHIESNAGVADSYYALINAWEDLETILREGDGEKDEDQ